MWSNERGYKVFLRPFRFHFLHVRMIMPHDIFILKFISLHIVSKASSYYSVYFITSHHKNAIMYIKIEFQPSQENEEDENW